MCARKNSLILEEKKMRELFGKNIVSYCNIHFHTFPSKKSVEKISTDLKNEPLGILLFKIMEELIKFKFRCFKAKKNQKITFEINKGELS